MRRIMLCLVCASGAACLAPAAIDDHDAALVEPDAGTPDPVVRVQPFEVLEDVGCVPQCAGLECGPDPLCGMSCGSCPFGGTCNAGVCDVTCRQEGQRCEQSSDCCSYAQGTGYCVGGQCASSCAFASDCSSGCCQDVREQRVCLPAGPVGRSCSTSADCCGAFDGSGTCVTSSDGRGTCRAYCTLNSECPSGCCGSLKSGRRACLPSGHCR